MKVKFDWENSTRCTCVPKILASRGRKHQIILILNGSATRMQAVKMFSSTLLYAIDSFSHSYFERRNQESAAANLLALWPLDEKLRGSISLTVKGDLSFGNLSPTTAAFRNRCALDASVHLYFLAQQACINLFSGALSPTSHFHLLEREKQKEEQ